MEKANGLLTTQEHDVATLKINRTGVSSGKGRKTSFRETIYYATQSQRLERFDRLVGVSELETDENGDWTQKIWEWK